MALTEALRFLITSDSTQAVADQKRLAATTQSTMGGLDKLKGAFAEGLGIGSGIAAVDAGVAALSALGGALIDVTKLAEGDARSQFTLAQAIRNNTSAAGDGIASAEAYIASLSRQAAIADDELRPAMATLVRSTNDVAEAQKLLGLASDVAAGTGADVTTVADALAKAYQGNTRSLKSLAPEMTRFIRDGASATEIFASLGQVYAGNAAGLADVSPWQRLTIAVDEAKESIGVAFLPLVQDAADTFEDIAPAISGFADGLGIAVQIARVAADEIRKLKDNTEEFFDSIPGFRAAAAAAGFMKDQFHFGQGNLLAAAAAARGFSVEADAAAGSARNAATGTGELTDAQRELISTLGGVSGAMFDAERAKLAFDESLADTGGSGSKTASSMRGVENAARSLADAQKGLAQAEFSRFLVGLGATTDEISSAQIAERESTRSLASAKRTLADAERNLAELRNGGLAASRAEAQASFIEAQRALAEATAGGDIAAVLRARAALTRAQQGLDDTSSTAQSAKLADAETAVAAARDGVTKAAIDQRAAQKDLNDTLIKGRDGSKELADANRQVEDAQRRVEDASRSLVDAQDSLAGSTSGLASSQKDVNEKFLDGIGKAGGWLKTLADGQTTPEVFADAVDHVRENLKGVAEQAGKLDALDAYLAKVTDINNALAASNGLAKTVTLGPKSYGVTSANAAEERLKRTLNINLSVSGRTIADAVIDESNLQGGLPIRIKATS